MPTYHDVREPSTYFEGVGGEHFVRCTWCVQYREQAVDEADLRAKAAEHLAFHSREGATGRG